MATIVRVPPWRLNTGPQGGAAESTNYSGVLADIVDDPTSPDNNWITSVDKNSLFQLSFTAYDLNNLPPVVPLTPGFTQQLRAWVRKSGGTGEPTVRLSVEVVRSGSVQIIQQTADIPVFNQTGQLVTLSFNSNLFDPSTEWVRVIVTGNQSGGGPSARAQIDLGALDWLASTDFVADVDINETASAFQAGVFTVDQIATMAETASAFAASRLEPPTPFILITAYLDLEAPISVPLSETLSAFASGVITHNTRNFLQSLDTAFAAGEVLIEEATAIRNLLAGTPPATAYGLLSVAAQSYVAPTESVALAPPVAWQGASLLESTASAFAADIDTAQTNYLSATGSAFSAGIVAFVPSVPVDSTASLFASSALVVNAYVNMAPTASAFTAGEITPRQRRRLEYTTSEFDAPSVAWYGRNQLAGTQSQWAVSALDVRSPLAAVGTPSQFAAGTLTSQWVGTVDSTASEFISPTLKSSGRAALGGTASSVLVGDLVIYARVRLNSTATQFVASPMSVGGQEQQMTSTASRFAASTVTFRDTVAIRGYFVAHEMWVRDPQALWPAFVDKPVYRVDKSQPSRYAWTNYNQYRVDHSQPRYAIFDTVDYGVSFAEFE